MEEFKLGEIVRLKSGGPKMTVSSYLQDSNGKQKVVCKYFHDNELKEVTLYVHTLEKDK